MGDTQVTLKLHSSYTHPFTNISVGFTDTHNHSYGSQSCFWGVGVTWVSPKYYSMKNKKEEQSQKHIRLKCSFQNNAMFPQESIKQISINDGEEGDQMEEVTRINTQNFELMF